MLKSYVMLHFLYNVTLNINIFNENFGFNVKRYSSFIIQKLKLLILYFKFLKS